MPYRPAPIAAAYIRYAFMSPPGKRFSTWSPSPFPTSRNPVVRLSRPHTTLTGAHDSDAYRL